MMYQIHNDGPPPTPISCGVVHSSCILTSPSKFEMFNFFSRRSLPERPCCYLVYGSHAFVGNSFPPRQSATRRAARVDTEISNSVHDDMALQAHRISEFRQNQLSLIFIHGRQQQQGEQWDTKALFTHEAY